MHNPAIARNPIQLSVEHIYCRLVRNGIAEFAPGVVSIANPGNHAYTPQGNPPYPILGPMVILVWVYPTVTPGTSFSFP